MSEQKLYIDGKMVDKDLIETVNAYVVNPNEKTYSNMANTVDLAGFTIDQIFKTLSDHSPDKDFIESYRNTATIAAMRENIINSKEFNDRERHEKLKEVEQLEKEQQEKAEKMLSAKWSNMAKIGIPALALILGGYGIWRKLYDDGII